MKKIIGLALGSAFACAFSVGNAMAQANDCTCVAPAGSSGLVVNTTPGVSYAGAQGPQTVAVGTAVVNGTVISVGPSGSVGGQFGPNCTWSAGPSSVVSVLSFGNGQLCLRVRQTEALFSDPVNAALLAALASAPGWIPLFFDDEDSLPFMSF